MVSLATTVFFCVASLKRGRRKGEFGLPYFPFSFSFNKGLPHRLTEAAR